jgi:type I restriction enzyme, S subunit
MSIGDLSNELTAVYFGDIANQIIERVSPGPGDEENFIGLQDLESGSLNIAKWGDEVELATQAFKVKKGDIIFARRNTYLKRVAVSPIDGICSADAMVINEKSDGIVNGFLKYFMQSDAFMNKAISLSAGSLSSRVKWKDLERQKFQIPSKENQLNALKILDKIESIVLQKEVLILKILHLKRVSISKFFSKNYLIGNRGVEKKFNETIAIPSGQVDPQKNEYADLPHIAPDNMEKNIAVLLPYKTAKEDGVKSGKYLFDENHILYSKIRPNLRKVVFPKFRGICSADVYPLKGVGGLNTQYLFFLLQSEHFNRYAISTSMRTGMPKINREDLLSYKYYLPNEDIQLEIVRYLKEIDKTYYELVEAKKKFLALKFSYLNSLVF